mmetsp:Transcript_35764/g.109636  ORF Transcript_35764/g.109636 Transcript_35764/m.109636 type:complete len:214 (+) Transcript_35764:154-795(+)
MSETLPPITGTGVLVSFTFPFDRDVDRKARLAWRQYIGSSATDTVYATVDQSGAKTVVHEQVTFPGDVWVAIEGEAGEGRLLCSYTATGKREQQHAIRIEATASAPAAMDSPPPLPPPGAEEEDADLAAAIAASLLDATPTAEGGEGSNSTTNTESADSLAMALALSASLCEEWRYASRSESGPPAERCDDSAANARLERERRAAAAERRLGS